MEKNIEDIVRHSWKYEKTKMSKFDSPPQKLNKTNLTQLVEKTQLTQRSDGAKSARFSTVSGARSHKSEPVDPWADVTVEQIDKMINEKRAEIRMKEKKKATLKKNSKAPPQKLKKEIEPIDNEIRVLNAKIEELLIVRDSKIPFYEKLPKDCTYYKHFIQQQVTSEIERLAVKQVREDKELLVEIANSLAPMPICLPDERKDTQETFGKPGKANTAPPAKRRHGWDPEPSGGTDTPILQPGSRETWTEEDFPILDGEIDAKTLSPTAGVIKSLKAEAKKAQAANGKGKGKAKNKSGVKGRTVHVDQADDLLDALVAQARQGAWRCMSFSLWRAQADLVASHASRTAGGVCGPTSCNGRPGSGQCKGAAWDSVSLAHTGHSGDG